jgi:hypothetical protein
LPNKKNNNKKNDNQIWYEKNRVWKYDKAPEW